MGQSAALHKVGEARRGCNQPTRSWATASARSNFSHACGLSGCHEPSLAARGWAYLAGLGLQRLAAGIATTAPSFDVKRPV